MNNQKIAGVPGLIGLLMIVSTCSWAKPCTKMIETVQGTEMYMSCHYLKIVAIILGIILMAISVEGIIKKTVSVFLLIATGMVCIWSTLESIGGLHICAMKEMACHTTVAWMRVLGILAILVGCIMLYNPKKQV